MNKLGPDTNTVITTKKVVTVDPNAAKKGYKAPVIKPATKVGVFTKKGKK
jgi:hypothetical protein